MLGRHRRTSSAGALVLLMVLAPGCGGDTEDTPAAPASTTGGSAAGGSATATQSAATLRPDPGASGSSGPSTRSDLGKRAEGLARQGVPADARVVVISIDGLGSAAVTRELTPTLARMLAEGAGTRNARTAVAQTETLPNHTSMVTGRRIDAEAGGHGVTWNTDTDERVPAGVVSVFQVIDAHGGSSAVVVGKSKFDIWPQSWPGTIDTYQLRPDTMAATSAAIAAMRGEGPELTFLHLAGPDKAGHAAGWGSRAYDDAVRRADAAVGRVVSAVSADPDLAGEVVVVVTADHGGEPGTEGHGQPAEAANYTIPFLVWGAGVRSGDLYRLDHDYADPGTARPSYDGPQPVRNGDVANLVTGLLGLPDVPGSEIGAGEGLGVE
jgi:hypothetical protein